MFYNPAILQSLDLSKDNIFERIDIVVELLENNPNWWQYIYAKEALDTKLHYRQNELDRKKQLGPKNVGSKNPNTFIIPGLIIRASVHGRKDRNRQETSYFIWCIGNVGR